LSRLIRNTEPRQPVLIGDRKYDLLVQSNAESKLSELFPVVTIMTLPDGSKGIPIQEVFKIEKEHRQQLEQAYQNGLTKGMTQGHQKGKTEGLTEARHVTEQFRQAVSDTVAQREAILEEARQNVLDIIIQTARKVTYDTIQLDTEMVAQMVARVIDQLIDKSSIKISVHPDHLPIVEQYLDRFLHETATIKDISFKADPRVRYGGCFIETPSGDVDARLTSQFEVIEQIVREGDDKR
jgi:flagellar assembly protein FliH